MSVWKSFQAIALLLAPNQSIMAEFQNLWAIARRSTRMKKLMKALVWTFCMVLYAILNFRITKWVVQNKDISDVVYLSVMFLLAGVFVFLIFPFLMRKVEERFP